MTDEKTKTKESRPQSANNPLARKKSNGIKHDNKVRSNLLTPEDREKLNKLTKNKALNLMNSPFKNEMKEFFFNDKAITTKNLFSEIKETKTKTRLPKIQSSITTFGNKRKTIKLGIIDANKAANNENIKDKINISDNQRKKLEINCGGITNKQNINGIILEETFREKEKLSNIMKNPFLTNKNDTKSEKICVNIKQKKKIKEPLSDLKEKKINTKKNINTNNISNSKEKIEIKNIDKEDYPNENINNNNLDVKTKNNNENKIVTFNKEVSVIDILKQVNDNYDIEKIKLSGNDLKDDEKNNTKDDTNFINNNSSINIDNTSVEIKFISNININTHNFNINDNYNYNGENKYNNYDFKQTGKNSANSNKNLSVISEHINTSKFEPSQEMVVSNNKINGESSSDKNCGFIQSISNNIETDTYLHKAINYGETSTFLGEMIYESPRSVIYKGLDLNTGKMICIKRYINKSNLIEFQREKEFYELINSKEEEEKYGKNIIKYIGFKCEDDNNFLFLEYSSGDNLKKIIKLYGGSLNEKIIRIYVKQILHALQFLHNNLKVAHCDIKCSNILLDKDGIIKLIDFGSSGIIEKQNKENEKKTNNKNIDKNKPFCGFRGSFPWCSPEILNSQNYGTKCDIWSLGCTIIEMGGIEPWNNTIKEVYDYINVVGKTKEIPEIPKQFSPELKDFVLNCLEKDPDKRPDTNFLLNHIFINGEKS